MMNLGTGDALPDNEMNQLQYDHTQCSPLGLWLYVIAIGMFVWSWFCPPPANHILHFSGVVMMLIATSFLQLRVQDEGDQLGIRFGPLPLFAKTIRYDDITAVEPDRTTLLEGWGIHKSFRGGWVWNIWGRDCVLVDHAHRTRIGTDDVANLVAFLRHRAGVSGS